MADMRTASIAVGGACALLSITAAFVPHWIVVDQTTTVGLRAMCSGSSCAPASYASLASVSKCCANDTTQFARRIHAVEAFVWFGAWLSAAAAALAVTKRGPKIALHGFNVLAVLSFVISAAVAFSLFDMHSPTYHCTLGGSKPCFYYGASGIAAIIALFSAVLATGFGFFTRKTSFVFALIAAAFAIAAALSSSWFIASPTSLSNQLQSIGTLQSCQGSTCKALDYDVSVAASCRAGHGGQFRSRMAAVTSMMLVSFVFSVATAVVAIANAGKPALIAVTFLAMAGALVGVSIAGDTFDFWLGCGESLAGYIQTVSSGNAAGYWGISFAAAVTATILPGLLLIAHVAAKVLPSSHTSEPVNKE